MGLDLASPHHTTLSRRGGTVEVPEFARGHNGPIHLAIDSTGLKITGDGQWHAHRHRTAKKRRRVRKLHLGVDAEGFVGASDLTDRGADDASVGVAMVGRIEAAIGRITADGAYDKRIFYQALFSEAECVPTIVIPPRKDASTSKPTEILFEQRDEAIERISEVGRRRWRKESGAHQQARAENGIFRYKHIIGHALSGRTSATQTREAKIGTLVKGRMTALGMPVSVPIAP